MFVKITIGDWTSHYVTAQTRRLMRDDAKASRREVAGRLMALRAVTDLTQGAFGAPVGISQNQLSQYETGKRRLPLDPARRICVKYKVTLDWLYDGDESKLPHDLALKLQAAVRDPPSPDIPPPPRQRRKSRRDSSAPLKRGARG